MMDTKKAVYLFLLAFLMVSCSARTKFGGHPENNFEPLFGSSTKGVAVAHEGGFTTVTFSSLPAEGVFIRVPLISGTGLASQEWSGAGHVVHLAVANQEGIELGVVPLSSYQGEPISVSLQIGDPKEISVPPLGDGNIITDLSVTDAEGGQVLLEWTQVNVGDYDLNGEVNIADITPIVLNYQDTYDLLSTQVMSNPLYWIDGKADGEINQSDITPIGIHYGAAIYGYNIRHNGADIPGTPNVLATEGTPREGLPSHYSVTLPGLVTDSWRVTPVDYDGVEGADSDGNAGPVDLLANIDISGQLLLDLDGANPGGLSPDKISSRVIIDVEEVDSITIGEVNQLPGTGSFEAFNIDVAPNRVVYFQVLYLPSVDLATGGDRTISSAKTGSAVSEDLLEIATIPVRIPDSNLPVEIGATIGLAEVNPDGGFFVHLDTTITYPVGDDGTPGGTVSERILLDVFNGVVSVDTDSNGDFEDEPELDDDDRDCISNRRAEQENDWNDFDDDEFGEIEIEGVISAFDEGSGMITLVNAIQEDGEPIEIPVPWTLFFSENTQFEEKIKVDGGDDLERNIDPSSLQVGDQVEVELYLLEDNGGLVPTKYWIEKIERRIEET